LGGLEKPNAGTITNNKNFAYVFQDNNLFYDLSIIENLSIYNSKENVINELLTLVNLYEKKNTPVRYLSGGEIQRISIIRAFLSGADIILLDEPTSALDSKNEKIIYELLKKFSDKRLIITVSHNISILESFSDIILKIENKKILVVNQNKINYDKIKKTKEKSLPSKKTLNLYTNRLISKSKFQFFSVTFILTFIFSLLIFLSSLVFDSKTNYLNNTYKQSDFNYYPLEYKVYNSLTNKIYVKQTGKYLFDTLDGEDIIFGFNVRTKKEYIKPNIFVEKTLKGVYISDALANILDIKINEQLVVEDKYNNKINFKITQIFKTNYNSEMLSSYLNGIVEPDNLLTDEIYDKYFSIKIGYDEYLKAYSESTIKLPGNNFFDNDFDYKEYSNVGHSLNYISVKTYNKEKGKNFELSGNKILVNKKSRNFEEKYTKGEVFKYKNFKDSLNSNVYLDLLNIYDIKKEVEISDFFEDDEAIDIIISEEFMKKIVEENLYYLDKINLTKMNKKTINKLFKNDIIIKYKTFEATYELINLMKGPFSNLLKILIIVFLVIWALLINHFIRKIFTHKKKEIAILNSIYKENKKVSKIFFKILSLMMLTTFVFGFFISIILKMSLNKILMEKTLYNAIYKLTRINGLITFFIFLVIAIVVYLIYLLLHRIIKKTDVAILFKDGR